MADRLSDLEYELDCAYIGQARAMRHVAAVTVDRDTMAATLRGLLLQRAEDSAGRARMYLAEGRGARTEGFRDQEAWCHRKAGGYYADAALSLVLAMLIGGDHV